MEAEAEAADTNPNADYTRPDSLLVRACIYMHAYEQPSAVCNAYMLCTGIQAFRHSGIQTSRQNTRTGSADVRSCGMMCTLLARVRRRGQRVA